MRNRSRSGVTVAVVGAGVAGMTAALHLLDAGCDVVLIERSRFLGGKFGGILLDGIHHEHAYHFFSDWCLNFWNIAARIGLDRDRDFALRPAVKFLRRKADPDSEEYAITELKYFGSPHYFWANVYSRVARWYDMFIYVYSMIDLVSDQSFEQDEVQNFLNVVSVNAFMRSRYYSTAQAALLHQETLLKTFAVPSYETSARAYRTFLKFLFPPRPSESDDRQQAFKVLTGPSQAKFFGPFLDTLNAFNRNGERRFVLLTSTTLTDIALEPLPASAPRGPRSSEAAFRVAGLGVVDAAGGRRWLRPDHVILAIPHESLSELVTRNQALRAALPELLVLRKLRSQQMPSLDLYFTRPLPNIPREHVTLVDPASADAQNRMSSAYGLSFIDNSQAWCDEEHDRRAVRNTVLNVVSSDFEPLAALPEAEAVGAIIDELRKYVTFKDADIDRDRSHFQAHLDAPLFTNRVGSWEYRPEIRPGQPEQTCRRMTNLHLAGDYCRSPIDIVCVEGAIFTAMLAAREISDAVPEPREREKADGPEWDATKVELRPWLALAERAARARPGGPGGKPHGDDEGLRLPR